MTVKHLYFSFYHLYLATTVKLKEAMDVSCKELLLTFIHVFRDLIIWSFFTPQMRCLFRRGRRLFKSWTLVFTSVLLFSVLN